MFHKRLLRWYFKTSEKLNHSWVRVTQAGVITVPTTSTIHKDNNQAGQIRLEVLVLLMANQRTVRFGQKRQRP